MAVSGQGTQSDPWIVHSWDELQSVMGNSGYAKFDNVHETISGSGTQADPYIVSTYEEMLSATQADYIWQVKLIDKDNKIYKYNNYYCRYDESLSTVDFNTIYPDGMTSSKQIFCNVDFNGWTFRNWVLKGNVYVELTSGAQNGRFINMYHTEASSSATIKTQNANTKAENFIFDITISGSDYCYMFDTINIKNSAIHCHAISGRVYFGKTLTLENVHVTYDVNSSRFMGSVGSTYSGTNTFKNCLFDGKINAPNNGDTDYISYYTYNCIFNIEALPADDRCKLNIGTNPSLVSFYNSDTMRAQTGLANYISATTTQLKEASFLASYGFPIGVN